LLVDFYCTLTTTQRMNYNPLGNTGVLVSEICLGTMTFGGDWPLAGDG
jgi:hypothetical protein